MDEERARESAEIGAVSSERFVRRVRRPERTGVVFLDYLATMHKVNSSGHGYGGMFSLSLFDKHWVPNMSRAQSLELVKKCVAEIQERLVVAPGEVFD